MVADLQYVCEELERKIKLLEAENKTLKEREFLILRDLPEIVFLIDMNERFTFLNNTCIEKFKFTENEMEDGIYLKDIITAESLIPYQKTLFKRTKQGKFSCQRD